MDLFEILTVRQLLFRTSLFSKTTKVLCFGLSISILAVGRTNKQVKVSMQKSNSKGFKRFTIYRELEMYNVNS